MDVEERAEFGDERLGVDLAGFKTMDETGGAEEVAEFVEGERAEGRELGVGALEIEGDDYVAQVKNEGAGGGRHPAAS